MTQKTINCAECNVEYTYETPTGYPDKRKYCANCSEKKNQNWDNRGEAPAEKPKDNGFHLTPEKIAHNKEIIKCRALESAIAVFEIKLMSVKEEDALLRLADKFVKWIRNGN